VKIEFLPHGFGLEQPILDYVVEAAVLPTFIASNGSDDVGFLTLEPFVATAVEPVSRPCSTFLVNVVVSEAP
jgi:hypothetical protein